MRPAFRVLRPIEVLEFEGDPGSKISGYAVYAGSMRSWWRRFLKKAAGYLTIFPAKANSHISFPARNGKGIAGMRKPMTSCLYLCLSGTIRILPLGACDDTAEYNILYGRLL